MRDVASNLLLEGLKAPSRAALLADCEQVTLQAGQRLYAAGDRAAHAYFPTRGTISQAVGPLSSRSCDLELVGFEGMLGIGLALNSGLAEFGAEVQSEGLAWRISSAQFARHLAEQPALRVRMNRYAYVRLLQLTQDVICRSLHSIEERLARHVLRARDRARSGPIALTHEMLARLLGVRRAGITLTASAWRERKLVRYARGHIQVLDAAALKATACSCYAAEKRIYSRYLSVAERNPE